MLAFRWILKVKPGKWGKAIELAQSVKKVCPDWEGRIYTSEYGPGDTLIFEDEHESVAEFEAYWNKYHDKPEFTAWWNEWNNKVADSGSSTDVWYMIDV